MKLISTVILFFVVTCNYAQIVHVHKVYLPPYRIHTNQVGLGSHVSPVGDTLALNNVYLEKNGNPIYPVMGEFQHSRYPRECWEEELLKMKASGIDVIGFYAFWILHEPEEGLYRFDDQLDIRAFLKLLHQHHMQAVVRIGPWVHGETRNGGFPDWFVRKYLKGGFDRSFENDVLKPEVKAWYQQLATQMRGLYFKDGGPIIGVQLDNEVRCNGPESNGYRYLKALKSQAIQAGIDVPYYFVTGWPGTRLPEEEVIPLWGGYPAAPWTGHTEALAPNKLYTFITDRRDQQIGTDILQYDSHDTVAAYKHPFLTVELGGGIQDTYHRRPVIAPKDLMAINYTRIGAGANMLGYYIYHGVQHPLSQDTTMGTQETKGAVFPYPNDYPYISYDFQAPISESGYIRPSYHYLKRLHLFLHSYGQLLAPMAAITPSDSPKDPENTGDLRYAIRYNGKSGFIFFNNYSRHQALPTHTSEAFELVSQYDTLRIPHTGSLQIPEETMGMIPFQYPLAKDVMLAYATAHPLTILDSGQLYVYYAQSKIDPVFVFRPEHIKEISCPSGRVTMQQKCYVVDQLVPGKACDITIVTKEGKQIHLLLLTEEEALHSYVFQLDQGSLLFLTEESLFYNEIANRLHVVSEKRQFTLYTYPALNRKHKVMHKQKSVGRFSAYDFTLARDVVAESAFEEITDQQRYQQYLQSRNQTPERPAYGVRYASANEGRLYQLHLPDVLPPEVKDYKLLLNYRGNTLGLYADDILVEDDFFNGQPKVISYNRLQKYLKKDLRISIQPLWPKSPIYFDPGVHLSKDHELASLDTILTVPVYEITF